VLPRTLLLACLGVGLGAVWFAARAHLRGLERSLEANEARALRADLKERAGVEAEALRARLRDLPPLATYDADGRLQRPAPPATARPYRAPDGTVTALYLGKGDFERALDYAATSAERAAVFLRRGVVERDPALVEKALAEEAFRGTDLWYRARLAHSRLRREEPDAAWVDDVSALLGGSSDAFAKALLEEAGIRPVLDRETRAALAALRPRPGVTIDDGSVRSVVEKGDALVLRSLPRAALDLGAGPVAVPLPEPVGGLAVRGRVDEAAVAARLAEERWKTVLFYGFAALTLVVGTAYAIVAIGRAQRLANAKSDFIANVTHELRTPIANIRLFAESLRDGRVRAGDAPEFVDTILAESGRLESLVEGLLHAARGPRLDLGVLDPRGLVEEAAARWRPRLEREGFALDVRAPALPGVRGDREALLRALSNLLDNARKYAAKNRRIEFSGAAANGTVRLAVRDHGPGIPVAERERVLQPFVRLEDADRKATSGTGLGLSLVVACAEAHGGRVEVEGGEGARVTIVLPVAEEPA